METRQLDPQAQALLNQMAASGASAPRNIIEARQGCLEIRPLAGAPEPVNKVEDRQIPGAAGIPVRIYTKFPCRIHSSAVRVHDGIWQRQTR